MKLLLIEDEDFIRDLYKRQLELAGMPTDAFGLGNDGLNAAHQTPTAYDLVLLDIMLPDTNGLQILKDLKQNNATKQIPVILLTNLSQDMLIKEGFELGAEGYLVKAAYTPAQIVQEVKNILAKKQSQPVSPQSPQVPGTPVQPAAPAIQPAPPVSTTPPAPANPILAASPTTPTPSTQPTSTTPDPLTAPAMPANPATPDPMSTPTTTPATPDPTAPLGTTIETPMPGMAATPPIEPPVAAADSSTPTSTSPLTPATDLNNSH